MGFPAPQQDPRAVATANPIAKKCYAFDEATAHFFVKDDEHPYVQDRPFDWIRGYQVGGKSLIWARQTQRWSRFDFEGPARDGFGEWPITYDELAPWYSHVERFAGISGNYDGLETLPDGEFLPAWEMNDVEKNAQGKIMAAFPGRHVIQGRCAHLTAPQPQHLAQNRGQCQARNLCYRGCPFGAYFSSNSSTLPAAAATGRLTLRPHSVVESILHDPATGRASGVRVIDAVTKQATEFLPASFSPTPPASTPTSCSSTPPPHVSPPASATITVCSVATSRFTTTAAASPRRSRALRIPTIPAAAPRS